MQDRAHTVQELCGEKWLDDYISELPQSELQKVSDKQSARPFRFGDWKVVHSTRKVIIPAKLSCCRYTHAFKAHGAGFYFLAIF